jgi:YidC/Oxa1 family membrane protein insertase
MKGENSFLPVGIYNKETKNFTALDDLKTLHPLLKKASSSTKKSEEETFYLLENETLQLLFSTKGGALKEINLPLQSQENERSVVKAVENDRIILERYPQNGYFPSHPYQTIKEGKQVEEMRGKLGGYTPLIRRDLSDKNLSLLTTSPYYALNLVSEYKELSETPYKVTLFEKDKIVFEADQGFRKITKTFSFPKENVPYMLDLSINVEGSVKNLNLTSGVPEVELVSGAPQPTLKMRTKLKGKESVEELKLPTSLTTATSASLDWLATSNGFFAILLNPLNQTESGYKTLNVSGTVSPSRLVQINDVTPETYPGYMALLPLKGKGPFNYRIFAGPLSEKILKEIDTVYTDKKTLENPNYTSMKSYYGWFAFISEPFSKFLYLILNLFHSLTGSWGLSIILLTVVLRVILYPLNAWSARSTLKMQELTAKSQALQEKYKNDQKRYQLEMMNLYRETGANPFSGCLISTVIQIPFLLGMFGLLKTSFSLRGAPFIPGWIDDLSAPDVLFSWETPIWFIGNQFHLLPFLLGAVMFLQQRWSNPLPKDVNQMTEQQRQARAMGTMMGVMFVFIFYNFPSGLNLYWLSSTLLGILQQIFMKKQMTTK